ncbi:hypothetical protein QTO34_000368 [Cnephaeus nilssonii]|uniref:MAGE domain-containing protein n=1 Tax=Cnephaeus nilssonii TaxID=3371016 RepID=A0AA40ICD1_CNENI|nr:hypothetical protein QTO34_000368 [Eptesicus nilssonii]
MSLPTTGLEEVFAAETPSPPQCPQGACPSSHALAAFRWNQSEDENSSSQDEDGPNTKGMTEMVEFLLLKYCAKEPTTKAEMLSSVIKEH